MCKLPRLPYFPKLSTVQIDTALRLWKDQAYHPTFTACSESHKSNSHVRGKVRASHTAHSLFGSLALWLACVADDAPLTISSSQTRLVIAEIATRCYRRSLSRDGAAFAVALRSPQRDWDENGTGGMSAKTSYSCRTANFKWHPLPFGLVPGNRNQVPGASDC